MRKMLLVLVAAGLMGMPEALAGQSVVRKPWQDRFLPSSVESVPWLSIDRQTRWPKGDYPLGRRTQSVGWLVLDAVPGVQMSLRDVMERGM